MGHWQRPPGPLNVWKVVDGYEKLSDESKKPVKFSIQEIPKEDKRKKEVFDLLIAHHISAEPVNKSLNIKDDPDAIDDYLRRCKFVMNQGVSIGCYKLDSDGEIGELVGVGILYIMTDEAVKDFEKMRNNAKSKNFVNFWNLADKLSGGINPFKIFQVDKYIASLTTCVNSAYSGQKLGYHLLDSRSAIGKKYGIHATSTVFTSGAAQRQAQRAGFKESASIDYAELVDDQGHPYFPNIESKSAKIMMKSLPQ